MGLREQIVRRHEGRRNVVHELVWRDPDEIPEWSDAADAEVMVNSRGWSLHRRWASPVVGGPWYEFEPVSLYRWPDGPEACTRTFWMSHNRYAPRLYLSQQQPDLDDDELRLLGTANYVILAQMWPRLRQLMLTKRSPR